MDASNVVGSRPDGWWRDRPRALHRLQDEVVRWRAEAGEPVLVVADGHPDAWVPEGTQDRVHVRYAHSTARDAADDEIVQVVSRHEEPESLVVVTSDRALEQRVRDLGATTEGAGRFRRRIEDIDARRRDRAVLAAFGTDESLLIGRGGEARVFALDGRRVLRLAHPGTEPGALGRRRELLDRLAAGAPHVPFAVPEVLDQEWHADRAVVVERRLDGRNALEALSEGGTDRGALIRNHLDAAAAIARLPCPTSRFGELWGEEPITAPSFAAWALERLRASLAAAHRDFSHLDPARLTDDLVRALGLDDRTEGRAEPVLVHLDAFLGNMLASGDTITAVVDFGPMTIGGVEGLDPAVAVAYLAPEITPSADDGDRAVARRWARDAGLSGVLAPAEAWIAAYWTAAVDDERLQRWCRRILLPS